MEVRQDAYDPNKGLFKIEPDPISVQPGQNYSTFEKVLNIKTESEILDTYNVESQTTGQFADVGEIKQEIIECEDLKIEEQSDFPVKIEDTSDVREVNNADLFVDKKTIKQEIGEIVQFKTENELLTSHCDLPTLKNESVYPDYFEQPCSSKQANPTLKPLKHNIKKKRSYPCPICLKSFPFSKTRLDHYVRHFAKRPINDRSLSIRKKHSKFNFGKYDQDCFYCGRCFLNSSQFIAHFIVYHYVKSPLKCRYCLKVFVKRTILEKHMKIHTLEKLFKCEICSKNFAIKSDLTVNLKIHTGKKLFKCDICFKNFTTKSHLTTHLKIHTGEKQFSCKICSKNFITKSHLTIHLISHTGEKPFKCEICTKNFITKFVLTRHLKIHSVEKPFKCTICFKNFTTKSYLTKHLKIHYGEKPFSCEICSKKFTAKYSLTTHLKIHTGEKQFRCKICSKNFITKSHLTVHLKNHTGVKPFKCEICSKNFITKYQLTTHFNTHWKKYRSPVNSGTEVYTSVTRVTK